MIKLQQFDPIHSHRSSIRGRIPKILLNHNYSHYYWFLSPKIHLNLILNTPPFSPSYGTVLSTPTIIKLCPLILGNYMYVFVGEFGIRWRLFGSFWRLVSLSFVPFDSHHQSLKGLVSFLASLINSLFSFYHE